MKTAFLFPGQGAQAVGMGQDLYQAFPAAKSVFDLAEKVTRLPLKTLCFEGPEDQLARTDVSQPAIFTVSAATLAVMDDLLTPEQAEAVRPTAAAGLSLGEYTALYAADVVDLADMLELVALRGRAMQEAADTVPSGMVSVLGLDEPQAEALCREAGGGQVLACANFNCPGQIVLSGEADACGRAAKLARQHGAKGAVPLKVAGAFHSELMQPAADRLGEALAGVTFRRPSCPVVGNVDGEPSTDPEQAKEKLLSQLISPVRWQRSMERLVADGVERFFEIGPGRVLAGLMRRIRRGVEFVNLNSREAVERLAAG